MKGFNKLWLVALVALSCLVGCKTSQNVIRSSSVTVEGLIKGYALYVTANDIPAAEQESVWLAYDKYQKAEDRALLAYGAYHALGDKAAWEYARIALEQARWALVELLPQPVTQGTK